MNHFIYENRFHFRYLTITKQLCEHYHRLNLLVLFFLHFFFLDSIYFVHFIGLLGAMHLLLHFYRFSCLSVWKNLFVSLSWMAVNKRNSKCDRTRDTNVRIVFIENQQLFSHFLLLIVDDIALNPLAFAKSTYSLFTSWHSFCTDGVNELSNFIRNKNENNFLWQSRVKCLWR